MDWVTGFITILGMELVSRRDWRGWLVCLCNQVFWIYLIIDKKLWGLLPLTVLLIWRYTVFLIRWRRDQKVVLKTP